MMVIPSPSPALLMAHLQKCSCSRPREHSRGGWLTEGSDGSDTPGHHLSLGHEALHPGSTLLLAARTCAITKRKSCRFLAPAACSRPQGSLARWLQEAHPPGSGPACVREAKLTLELWLNKAHQPSETNQVLHYQWKEVRRESFVVIKSVNKALLH